jgi:hypothetical protein
VLIRPNLAPLGALLGVHYVYQLWTPGIGRRAIWLCVAFGASLLPGVLAVAVINRALYGSPFTSGYGSIDELFALSRMGINFRHYATWLIQVHTPVALLGVAAIFFPLRRLWPAAPDRRVFGVIAAFVIALWAIYCAWDVFDSWLFTRFLLSSWPFIMLGVGAVAAWCMRSRISYVRPVAIATIVALGLVQWRFGTEHAVLDFGRSEHRNVAVARFVQRLTPENSVIISLHHSGSLRYYAGRTTIYFPWLDGQWLDRSVEWLAERGVRTYALIEDWEIAEFKQRYAGQTRLAALDQPLGIYGEPGRALLLDLTGPVDPGAKPVIAEGGLPGWRAVPPVPLPSLKLALPSAE